MNVLEHNRIAWDKLVEKGNPWTVPASREAIDAARSGRWHIVLTPTKAVPRSWLDVAGRQVLCLASGGGQQGPILAAAGGIVTVLDNSPKQLERDAAAAQEYALPITAIRGDMANLDMFADASFDLVVHPVSNCFVPDILPVWREAFRVLRPGGSLLSGFTNPAVYIFDLDLAERTKRLEVKNSLPYSDAACPADEPFEFSHTLEAQIGGQIAAGFAITGMYEDLETSADGYALNRFMSTFIATRAVKPVHP